MKRILITGADSYIGTSFENYLKQWPDIYKVDTIDMIDGTWKEKSFAEYDSIVHVAGIAHQKESRKSKDLYFKINRDLTIATAQKAKHDGVKQFVFLSSMSVYGLTKGAITRETFPNPTSSYGRSKLEAEEGILKLNSNNFRVAIVRPPMVYGYKCKGNFQSFVKIVKKTYIFPYVKNKRSVIYIENLCSFIKELIDNESSGIWMPQDRQYINTSHMALQIASALNKKLYLSHVLGLIVKVGMIFVPVLEKAFGSLYYDEDILPSENLLSGQVESAIIKSIRG